MQNQIKPYHIWIITLSALILTVPCLNHDTELLVEEVIPQKKTVNSAQRVATTMGSTLDIASQTVETLGLFQRNLIYLLNDTITRGRKATLAGQSKETRQNVINEMRIFCQQAELLISTIKKTIRTFSSLTSSGTQSAPNQTQYNNTDKA